MVQQQYSIFRRLVYSSSLPGVHTLLLAVGLYLEVFIIAVLFYAVLRMLSPGDTE